MIRLRGGIIALAATLAACGAAPANTWRGVPYDELSQGDFAAIAVENRERSREVHERIAACIRQGGFEVTVSADGYETAVSPEQKDRLDDVIVDCEESLTAEGRIPSPEVPTRASVERDYKWAVAALRCLQESGYELPDPPTFDAYLDQTEKWSPFADLVNRHGAPAFSQAEARCPQLPPQPALTP